MQLLDNRTPVEVGHTEDIIEYHMQSSLFPWFMTRPFLVCYRVLQDQETELPRTARSSLGSRGFPELVQLLLLRGVDVYRLNEVK